MPANETALVEFARLSTLLVIKIPPCGDVILTVVNVSFLKPGKFLVSTPWSNNVSSNYSML